MLQRTHGQEAEGKKVEWERERGEGERSSDTSKGAPAHLVCIALHLLQACLHILQSHPLGLTDLPIARAHRVAGEPT